MLVACHLVNRASWSVARAVLYEILFRWPTVLSLSDADDEELKKIVRPLGFHTKRSLTIMRLARSYLFSPEPMTADDVERLPGCGRYAADSWKIFVEGHRDIAVTDGRLQWFLEKERGKNGETRKTA